MTPEPDSSVAAARRRLAASGPLAAAAGRGEQLFVAAWALLLLLLCWAPIGFGYAIAGEGWHFTGFHAVGLNDLQSYMAWIRQAGDGHLLMVDKFTAEVGHRAGFYPLFWLIGSLGRWTGAPIMALWHAVQGLGIVLLVYAIHRFAAAFTDSARTRALAVVLATTASGLGWAVPGDAGRPVVERPIDLWMEEANAFRVICSSFFTLTLGLALLLLACVWMLRYYDSGRLRDAALAGLAALALAAVHAYDVVTLWAVLGVWTLLTGRNRWPGMLVMVAISGPYMVYGFLLVRLDPVLSRVEFFMPVPPVAAHLVGWGLPLALAAVALFLPEVWRANRRVGLLAAWLALTPVLLLAPLDFRRKLIWGVSVVLCLLAAMALRELLDGRTKGRMSGEARGKPVRTAMVVVAVALLAFGSLRFYRQQFPPRELGRFLPVEMLDALAVLDERAGPDDVVLAGPALAGFLPGWAGVTAYWGHWAQTVDFARKRLLARRMLTPGGRLDRAAVARELSEQRVRYVVLDAASAGMGRDTAWPIAVDRLPVAPFVRPVYENEWVVLLEVRRPGEFEALGGMGASR